MTRGTHWSLPLLTCSAIACGTDGVTDLEVPDASTPLAQHVVDASANTDSAVSGGATPESGMPPRPLPMPSRASSCTAGEYRGEFNCDVNGLPIWGGKISFSLVAVEDGAGEFRRLQIVPGTRLEGVDNFAGSFGSDLVGTFDCDTGVLTGAIENGVYASFAGVPINMNGPLEGVYLDGPPPHFEGEMGPLTTPDVGDLSPTAQCIWSAVAVSMP